MVNLADIIYKKVKPIIESWEEQDIYAISFFIYDDGDDIKKPGFTLGYNTEAHYESNLKYSDPKEVRWNYAFWLQNQEYLFGYKESADIVQNWIHENGYDNHNDDNETKYDGLEHYIGKGPFITQKFVEQLILVANKLHNENIIKQKFGSPIPIIIHELEYYKAIADETKSANPDGVADDFINWVTRF